MKDSQRAFQRVHYQPPMQPFSSWHQKSTTNFKATAASLFRAPKVGRQYWTSSRGNLQRKSLHLVAIPRNSCYIMVHWYVMLPAIRSTWPAALSAGSPSANLGALALRHMGVTDRQRWHLKLRRTSEKSDPIANLRRVDLSRSPQGTNSCRISE